MVETVLDIATSVVLVCACGVIVTDLLRDVVVNIKKTIVEIKGVK